MRVTPVAIATAAAVLLSACADSTTPTASSAPTRSATTEAATPVVIYPGTDIQAQVTSRPAGTIFLLKAGRHLRQSVIPKSGNIFLGEPGAILDGENVTAHACHIGGRRPFPDNVQIKGLILEHYNPAVQMGPIVAGRSRTNSGSGWVVQECEIRYNATAGIRMGNKMKVLRNYIHHNGQIGLSGGTGDSILAEGNEIAFNNYERRFPLGWEEGGAKFGQTRWVVVRNNYVHNNYGNGLWSDVNAIYTLYEGNRVTDNAGAGISHEVSYDAVIRNNTIERNGFAKGWLYGAGIQINHSPNVEVYGNVVSGNRNGIVGMQQDRSADPALYGPHLLQNLYVHDNIVTMNTGRSGVAQDMGDNAVFTSRNNRYENNRYILGTNAKPFQWMNGARTDSQWRSYGQDLTGTFSR